MCLLNYNKEKKKYKHLTYTERTIRREIKRGLTINLNTYLEEIEVYSADIAHDEYLLSNDKSVLNSSPLFLASSKHSIIPLRNA